MKRPHLAVSLLIPLFVGYQVVVAQGAAQSTPRRDLAAPTCSIQITSVTVDPKQTQGSKDSYLATVTVQVSVLGQAPPGAVATVEVLTYSPEPPRNNVRYTS